MADVKITDLTAVASVVGTNTFEVTEDPSGTPVSKKATAAQLATYIDAAGAASSAVSTHVAAGDPHTQYKLESDFSANGASLVNAANYSSMRTLLSLVPGTDVQAFSSVLSTYAGIAPSANVQTLLGAADFAAFRTSLSLVVGTNVQAYDADLATIAGLTATTDNFLQAKSSAWASRTPTQVTADLIAMVGDSGSGGTKGLVPAPAAGDAAAGKYLKADGTWATVSGGGGSTDPLNLTDDTPATPASGSVSVYRSARGPEEVPGAIDPNAVKRRLGFDFLDGRYAYATATMQFGDAVTVFGIPAANVTGTQSGSGHPDGANYYKRRSRYRNATAASAGSAAGVRFGNGTGLLCRASGGRMRLTWGISDAAPVANAAVFAGYMVNAAGQIMSANVDPSTLINLIGIGADAGETTLSLMHNDGSGTATKTGLGTGSLGGTAPCNTSEVDVYTVAIECNPGGSGWRWYVERENTGDIWSGTVTTEIPSSASALEPVVWRGNRATALAARVDFFLLDAVQAWRG